MKKLITAVMATLTMAAVFSCGQKKETNVIIAPKPTESRPAAPTKMSDYTQRDTVTWLGRVYTVVVKRSACDSLPMVKDEQGRQYYDNTIRVQITRPDGSEFFNRTFRKTDFAACLDTHTNEDGALLGIVLDRADGDNLLLGASVGSPDVLSDEYIPIVITLSGHGDISYKRDTKLEVENQNPQENTADADEDDGV